MFRNIAAAILLIVPFGAVSAQDEAVQDHPPERVRSVTVYGNEACPKAVGDEILVCSHQDANEQFRIPKQFRELKPTAANNSWVNRAATVDEVGRVAGGLPDTCSVVGSGGQTGCAQQAAREFSADKRARRRAQELIP